MSNTEHKNITLSLRVQEDCLPSVGDTLRGFQERANVSRWFEPTLSRAPHVTFDHSESDNTKNKIVMFREIKISVSLPEKRNVSFLGRIEHHQHQGEYQNKLTAFESSVDDLDWLKHRPYCQHCEKTKSKRRTYLLHLDGCIKQLSSTCLPEFFSEDEIAQANLAFDLVEQFTDEHYWSALLNALPSKKGQIIWYPMARFLQLAETLTKRDGFIKSDQPNCTRDLIIDAILSPETADSELATIVVNEQNTTNLPEAEALIDFYRQIDSNSTYVANIKGVLLHDYIKLDNRLATGIMASAPSSYYRAIGKEETNKLNEPFGAPKERGVLKLFVHRIVNLTDREFPSVIYSMRDDHGREFSWKASWPGNNLLSTGKTVTMTATIKDHSVWKDTHCTRLSRCADIKVVDRRAPSPDFYEAAKKRGFKEHHTIDIKPYDLNKNVDGHVYLHLDRSWREKGVIRHLSVALKMEEITHVSDTLLQNMIKHTHIERKQKKSHLVPLKKDLAFITDVEDTTKPYLSSYPLEGGVVYWVDDAFAPVLSKDPINEGNPQGTTQEQTQRAPRLFFDLPAAEQHGKRLHCGRLLKIKVDDWRPAVLPSDFRLEEASIQQTFKECCERLGFSAIVLADQDRVKWCEPLHTLPETSTYSIAHVLSSRPLHKPLEEALESRSQRALQGSHYITISFPFEQHALVKCVGELIDNLSSKARVRIYSQESLVSLREAFESDSLSSMHPIPLLLVDEVTAYYLKLLGGQLTNYRIRSKEDIPLLLKDTVKEMD